MSVSPHFSLKQHKAMGTVSSPFIQQTFLVPSYGDTAVNKTEMSSREHVCVFLLRTNFLVWVWVQVGARNETDFEQPR